MHMVGTTIHGMQYPSFVFARFSYLLLNTFALVRSQPASALCYASRTFEFQDRVGQPKATPVLDPPTCIAWEPGSIGRPGQQEGDRLVVGRRHNLTSDA